MEVSASQEAEWPFLADAAVHAVAVGASKRPGVWFRTDRGVSGSIPVSDQVRVRFSDDDDPARFLGAVVALGQAADPG